MKRTLPLAAGMLLLAFAAYAGEWTNVTPGVDYQEFIGEGADIHVTRIDLSNDSLQVVVSRESERGLKVSDFAKKNKAIVAMNGDYFDDKMVPVGLTISPCGPWAGSRDTSREGVLGLGGDKGSVRRQGGGMGPPATWGGGGIFGGGAFVIY